MVGMSRGDDLGRLKPVAGRCGGQQAHHQCLLRLLVIRSLELTKVSDVVFKHPLCAFLVHLPPVGWRYQL